MGWFNKQKEKRSHESMVTVTGMLGENPLTVSLSAGDAGGNDIAQAAIRTKATAVSKLAPAHTRGKDAEFERNPKGFERIKWLLVQPNEYMSMQDLVFKLASHREERGNAYAYIEYADGVPSAIYPVESKTVDMYVKGGSYYLKFAKENGDFDVRAYGDVIHLRKDFNRSPFFGDKNNQMLAGLNEVIHMTDKGIVKAIQNSAVVRWIMRFLTPLKKEDIEAQIDEFNETWQKVGKSGGVAPQVIGRYELTQVEPKNYIPDWNIGKQAAERIYSYYGVNEKIVQNKYSENEWNAFYESEIEPVAMQLSHEFTRTLFSRHEREVGNRIIFSAESLQYASMKTKLSLMSMVDRGAMTPNEWRQALNLPPIEGGDVAIRRLDTKPVGDESASPDFNKDDADEGGDVDE